MDNLENFLQTVGFFIASHSLRGHETSRSYPAGTVYILGTRGMPSGIVFTNLVK